MIYKILKIVFQIKIFHKIFIFIPFLSSKSFKYPSLFYLSLFLISLITEKRIPILTHDVLFLKSHMVLQKNYERLILMGDPHFGRFNNAYEHMQNNLDYLYDVFIPEIKKYTSKFGKDKVAVVVLGDLYDNEQLISGYVQSKIIKLFKEISSLCDVICLVGNHDLYKSNSLEDNNVIPLSLIPNIHLVLDDPLYVLCNEENMLGFVSWQREHTKFKNHVEKAKEMNVKHLFLHNSIYGFEYEGISVPKEDHLGIEDFASFKTVTCGHIHKFQEQRNIRYTGSLMHLRTVEHKNTTVGISVLHVGTDTYDFIENTYSPRYVRFLLEDLLNMSSKEAREKCRNNYVLVITKRYLGNSFSTQSIIEELKENREPVYRTISFKESYGETAISKKSDISLIDPMEESLDLQDMYKVFIGSVSHITAPKYKIELTDSHKADFIKKFNSAYAETSTLLKDEDQLS